ncbi:acyltransferase [Pararhizobium sp. YC-54]|uniref:acyltransferase family protein n=1 Tax=Pararhizobium sp. YC-54 TaxID=2986920 RepID=UPI0021F78D71|nr:acyltransferase family protein [Pararhizobium sp. YC-54]MCV9998539.1 acyltransferase [Pararhizobium sp. YC-54]
MSFLKRFLALGVLSENESYLAPLILSCQLRLQLTTMGSRSSRGAASPARIQRTVLSSSSLHNVIGDDHKIRADIQALRGFAVLVVLFYHANIGFTRGGFLGVDVFFVISGFLITGLIRDGIQGGTFNLWAFYVRRAKRLLPAAYATFLGAALLAPFFLASSEMRDFQRQLVGSLTFTANFSLLRQSGYFEGASELKPLLHIWSLAIEEQYYFLLPITLYCLPRRFWKMATMTVIVASLTFCWLLAQKNQAAAFYLLPTRAWELGIGSYGALLSLKNGSPPRWLKSAFWPAVVCLLVLPFVPAFGHHPGVNALAICVATLVIILRRHPLLAASRFIGAMGKFGDISYSLYLVHWPLFAFLNNSWLGEAGSEHPPFVWRAGLLLLSIALAVVLNRTIEKPLRFMPLANPLKVFATSLAASLVVLLLSRAASFATAPTIDYAELRRANHGLSEKCEFTANFKPIPQCRTADKPEMMVWGDSYAMHLLGGIARADMNAGGVVQATRSACGPMIGVAPVFKEDNTAYDVSWARNCIAFNDSVLAYLQTTSSIKTVVLSSLLSQYIDPTQYQLLVRKDANEPYLLEGEQQARAVEGLKATIDAVRAAGKKIVIIAPPPQSGLDIGRCSERLQRGLPVLGAMTGCQISQASYERTRKPVLGVLGAVSSAADIAVIRFDPFLCHSGGCDTSADGIALYRDTGHLSIEGSVTIAKKIGLVDLIKAQAR